MKLIRITTVPQSLRGLLKGQLKFMSTHGYDVIGVSSPGDALNDVVVNEGVRTVAIEMTRTISPFKDIKALIQLVMLFKKEKPDIIHTHTPKAGLLGMLAAKIVGVPHRLHTVAGMPLLVSTGFRRKILNLVEVITYACATKVYPNSFGLESIILKHKFTSKSKLSVIANGSSNGIDTNFFNPDLIENNVKFKIRKELKIRDNEIVFLFVGRVVADKGINELVTAFLKVNKEESNCHLVLVGNYENDLDPISPKIKDEIDNNANIHAVGFKKNVNEYFFMADVFVFPSYREGFPNVVMQACAMRLNCIVSDINGCNEIIKDGHNGWVIPVGNVIQLYEKMKWCMDFDNISQEMGRRGRSIMQNNYEREFVWKEILNEYKTLIND